MTTAAAAASPRPLRVRPAVVLALLIVAIRLVVPAMAPRAMLFGASLGVLTLLAGAVIGLVTLFGWWLFFSRAPWTERLIVLALMFAAVAAASRLIHPSFGTGFQQGLLAMLVIPALAVSLAAVAVAFRDTPGRARISASAIATAMVCAVFVMLRTDGITGDGKSQLHWRWTRTAEQRVLDEEARQPAPVAAPVPTVAAVDAVATKTTAADPVQWKPAEWPGFRGPQRDAVVRGTRIGTDWTATPPVELWRRAIGPGWSSFAVQGNLFYTQEQRGDDEVVSCYRLTNGEPVWRHRDKARLWEPAAGAGPRATPTLHNGRVYTLGATGIANALDAVTGAVVWTRNAAADTKKKVPEWGFASSPIVFDDVVIFAASGHLVAYDLATGEPRWLGPTGGGGYSSPQPAKIAGVDQILLMRGARTVSVDPKTGALLWDHTWEPQNSIVQPALTGDGGVLLAAGDPIGGVGTRRLAVSRNGSAWTVEQRWTSRALKPHYNDSVLHNGYLFGFDGSILACVDLADGERKWKGGRYGHGQLMLLADQNLLLVLSEDGELALVGATPDRFSEIARFKAIEGKTWNHPALVRDVLLVRNGEEMAAFRLARSTQ
jgi:outer membrane protein assembly factor BamB